MDFGDILNDWDKETSKAYGKKKIKQDGRRESVESSGETAGIPREKKQLPAVNPMEAWMRRHGIEDKDSGNTDGETCISPAQKRRQRHAMSCEAVVDLHGCTREDAWIRLETFFADCRRRGLQKVLIIHGKGTHSDGGSVLLQVVKQFIEQNPNAGESGFSRKEDGGSGSTWVLLK